MPNSSAAAPDNRRIGLGPAPPPDESLAAAAPRREGRPACDYLLVVGPGRSGSELLYRQLRRHPGIAIPEIKEGYYYRSPRAARRALAQAAADGRILADLSNLAYRDPQLPDGITRLRKAGCRTLAVVLLRDHTGRARSMMQFRRSRGEPSALRGPGRLEQSVVRDRLTPAQLAAIYSLDAEVVTLHFPFLTGQPQAALDALAQLCGLAPFDAEAPETGPVNASQQARNIWLSAAAKAAAAGLRRLGLKRPLQRIKDNPAVHRLLFRPLPDGAAPPVLSPQNCELLQAAYAECCAYLEAHTDRLADGLWRKKPPRPLADSRVTLCRQPQSRQPPKPANPPEQIEYQLPAPQC